MIGKLSGRQTHRDGPAFAIAHGMQLGVQSALLAANIPPFTRLDAVRWGLRCVASIIIVPGGPK